jgi:hypothetical protein
MVNIVELPYETVDAIVFYVEGTQDLLSLALTCRTLADVVCPRHIQFRLIRCDVIMAHYLWNTLAKDRSLARNVRTLEIGFGWTRHIPPRIPSNPRPRLEAVTFPKVECTLIAAIKNMTELISFKWLERSQVPAIDSGRRDDIWTALKQLPALRLLNVKDLCNGTTSRYKPIHDSEVHTI